VAKGEGNHTRNTSAAITTPTDAVIKKCHNAARN